MHTIKLILTLLIILVGFTVLNNVSFKSYDERVAEHNAKKALECLKLESPTDKQYKACAILLSNLK